MSANIKQMIEQAESILGELGLGSLDYWLNSLAFDDSVRSWQYCTVPGLTQVKQFVPDVGYRFAFLSKCKRRNMVIALTPDGKEMLDDVIVDGKHEGVIGAKIIEYSLSQPIGNSWFESVKYEANGEPDEDGVVRVGFQTTSSDLTRNKEFIERLSKYIVFRRN